MVWATSTNISSKCIQMDPKQLPEMTKILLHMKQVCVAEKCRGWKALPGSLMVKDATRLDAPDSMQQYDQHQAVESNHLYQSLSYGVSKYI